MVAPTRSQIGQLEYAIIHTPHQYTRTQAHRHIHITHILILCRKDMIVYILTKEMAFDKLNSCMLICYTMNSTLSIYFFYQKSQRCGFIWNRNTI